MLRLFSDFRRSWRLLKIMSRRSEAGGGDQRVEGLIESAVREADDLRGRMDALEKRLAARSKADLDEVVAQVAKLIERSDKADQKRDGFVRRLVEEHAALISAHETRVFEAIARTEQNVATGALSATETLNRLAGDLQTTGAAVSSLRDFSAQQAGELQRWKEAYDHRILQGFLAALVATLDEVEDRIYVLEQSGRPTSDLKTLSETLTFNLDAEGVLPFAPKLQERLPEDAVNVRVVGSVSTSTLALDGVVARIVHPGYELFMGNEKPRVIRPALVELFVCEVQTGDATPQAAGADER